MGINYARLYYPEISWCVQDLHLEYVPICWRFVPIKKNSGLIYKRTTHYLIKIDRTMDQEEKIKTIFHELRHVWQWENDLLNNAGTIWYSRTRQYHLWKFKYYDRPNEKDAFKYEELAYKRYLKERNKL